MLIAQQLHLGPRLQGIDLQVQAGERVHLLGPNGAGKTSLLLILSGLLSGDQGQVTWQGTQLDDFGPLALAGFRSLMEQQQQSVFPVTVAECLEFANPSEPLADPLEQALEIRQFFARPMNRLSGGEQRRVQIARALMQIWPAIMQGQGLILMDEPVQGLDFSHQHKLFRLLNQLAELGNVQVVSHHQLNLAQTYASRICLMKNGKLVANGPVEQTLQAGLLEQVFDCQIRILIDQEQNRLIQTYLA